MMKRFIFIVAVCLVSAHATAGALSPDSSEVVSARSAAFSWLLSLRRPDGGWGRDTAHVVTALNLVNSSALSPTDHQLTDKQLQIELLTDIWRQRLRPVTSGRLAEYTMALVSSCISATDFQGKDLTSMMRHRATSADSEVAPVVLASCLAGAPLRRRRYLRLLTTIEGQPAAANVSTERLALAVLELRCESARGGRRVEPHLTQAVRRLAAKQHPDGGYGDLYSTLLADQALRGEAASGWDSAASLRYILSHRKADGSLGSVRLTAAAVWVLAGRSLLHATDTACHRGEGDRTTTAEPALPSVGRPANVELPSSPPRLYHVTLWLWIGSRPDETYSRRLTVQPNTSVFECMQLAAQHDPHFEFSSELWPNGHYIHTIDGHREQKDGYHFWVLYRLSSPPDPANKPTQRDVHTTGVDRLKASEGGHVLFWYREV